MSGAAGIGGNNQEAQNWGSPALAFTGGIASLNDAQFSNVRNQTTGASYESFWARGKHNLTFGADFRRQQFNILSQQDPRGTFTFTGAATGSDFAGFLLGIPDTSSIAFGNADKYFRSSTTDLFISDDFRLRPGLTLNAGVRWDYNSPISELYGRLVNLNVTQGFSTATPEIGDRLVNPDRRNVSPRVAIAWRPLAASSMVVRAGYGVYYDTSVYQPIASLMAQQAPHARLRFVPVSDRMVDSASDSLRAVDGIFLPHGFLRDLPYLDAYRDRWMCLVAAENDRVGDSLRLSDLPELEWVLAFHRPGSDLPPVRQLLLLGIEIKVVISVEGFLALPAFIAGTNRVTFVQRALAQQFVHQGGLRALECPFDVVPLDEAFWWHPTLEHDPGHQWFRSVIRAAGAGLTAPDEPG